METCAFHTYICSLVLSRHDPTPDPLDRTRNLHIHVFFLPVTCQLNSRQKKFHRGLYFHRRGTTGMAGQPPGQGQGPDVWGTLLDGPRVPAACTWYVHFLIAYVCTANYILIP